MTLCKASGCARQIPARMLMCGPHWAMVPGDLQHAVWKHYRNGQESDGKGFTAEYAEAARAAIQYVANLEKQQRLAVGVPE